MQKWDPFYHKNLINQILEVNLSNKDVLVDIDYKISGLKTRDVIFDLILKTKDMKTIIPISIIDPIDEVEVFNVFRKVIYDRYMRYHYPLFDYESYEYGDKSKVDITKEKLVEMADFVMKKVGHKYDKFLNSKVFEIFEQNSFKNYNVLRVLSKNRIAMDRRVHIGLSVQNDMFRFNLFCRGQSRSVEDIFTLQRSPVFKLNLSLGTNEIIKDENYKDFIDILNTVVSLDPSLWDDVYRDYILESVYTFKTYPIKYSLKDDKVGEIEKEKIEAK